MTKTKTHYSYRTVEQMGEKQNKIKAVQCEESVASCRRRCVRAEKRLCWLLKAVTFTIEIFCCMTSRPFISVVEYQFHTHSPSLLQILHEFCVRVINRRRKVSLLYGFCTHTQFESNVNRQFMALYQMQASQ